MASLVAEAMVQCQETEATYAIITDEVRSLVLRSNVDLETDIDAEIFVAEKVSIRQIITHFVYRETREKGLCVLDYVSSDPVWSGVTASRNPRPLPRLLLRRSFEDFDVYTMQRDKLAWDDFMIWWKIYDEEAGISGMAPWNLQPGTRLPASQLRIFGEGGHQVWIPQGRPFIPIPFETKALVVRRYRPREDHLHHLYAGRVHDPNSQGHSFEISSAISAGRAQYSQTFLGRFDGEGPLMCLKLFDERFFPLPERAWGHQYRHSRERLTDFNLALDMIRREEAVYKRLEYLQGYLIPHCYGFHKARPSL
ncbi:hypothetical protein GLOTRDRAFT_133969 [Gloeophyllum trabeum ATCC 11539]|uniref:Uncharacterized protein n=1 Tax=Gloeophyllum trabeum (strain ATCC 11539 / FP-39264 / Madison 617) TaxID=670483 RepID=S7R7T0_GLOTA|nr:uncharacterized protein GLOTRDRAFT_133969 [Gloeophyllum trabeum ATCC 11539]EPQ50415.1 hypothetical protein GLOTRDRAFT_133969 [Gloeophyllum trabeum ATCC 11539]